MDLSRKDSGREDSSQDDSSRDGSGHDDLRRVVPFKPRAARVRPPVEDVGRYARIGPEDDYRHRMTMNGLAFLVCLGLAGAGVWLATTIAEMRKNQDCVLSGRRGCSPVIVPPGER